MTMRKSLVLFAEKPSHLISISAINFGMRWECFSAKILHLSHFDVNPHLKEENFKFPSSLQLFASVSPSPPLPPWARRPSPPSLSLSFPLSWVSIPLSPHIFFSICCHRLQCPITPAQLPQAGPLSHPDRSSISIWMERLWFSSQIFCIATLYILWHATGLLQAYFNWTNKPFPWQHFKFLFGLCWFVSYNHTPDDAIIRKPILCAYDGHLIPLTKCFQKFKSFYSSSLWSSCCLPRSDASLLTY